MEDLATSGWTRPIYEKLEYRNQGVVKYIEQAASELIGKTLRTSLKG